MRTNVLGRGQSFSDEDTIISVSPSTKPILRKEDILVSRCGLHIRRYVANEATYGAFHKCEEVTHYYLLVRTEHRPCTK